MTVSPAEIAFFATMEFALLVFAILLTFCYATLMAIYGHGWRTLPDWRLPADFIPATRVTVIIPARNEAANIVACLASIVGGDYPPAFLEIIVVDDHSEDETADLVRAFAGHFAAVRLLSLAEFTGPEITNAYKKKALQLAVSQAAGQLIVTTDADCLAGPQWLSLIVSVFQTKNSVQLLTGPVVFHREKTGFQRFQALDFLGLMGITGAGIHYGFQRMGNGANLAYRKTIFTKLDAYAGNAGQASGDDMFLIQQVAAHYPAGVFFLKNKAATIFTEASPDLRSFVQQRLRWGTKNAALPEWPIRLALGAVFLFCWSLIISVLALPLVPGIWRLLIFQLAVKASVDFLFLRQLCLYFDRRSLLRDFWPSFFLHTLYIALVGLGSLVIKKFEWKGRRVA